MAQQIQIRHDTFAAFTANNPTLMIGELSFETDTRRMKRGTGAAAYNVLPYEFGTLILRSMGNDGTLQHTGDAVRTSLTTLTLLANQLGENGALVVELSARLDAAPAGVWKIELELDGVVIASFASLDQEQTFKRCVMQNQDDVAVNVAAADQVRDLTIDTSADTTLELFAQLDAADTAKTVEVFSFVPEVKVR